LPAGESFQSIPFPSAPFPSPSPATSGAPEGDGNIPVCHLSRQREPFRSPRVEESTATLRRIIRAAREILISPRPSPTVVTCTPAFARGTLFSALLILILVAIRAGFLSEKTRAELMSDGEEGGGEAEATRPGCPRFLLVRRLSRGALALFRKKQKTDLTTR